MDIDGFPLAAISEKSYVENGITPTKSSSIHPIDSNGAIDNENISSSKHDQPAILETSIYSERPSSRTDNSKTSRHYEVTSVRDEDDDKEREEKFVSQRPSQLIPDRDSTMVSSYTTGGENDVIEIHQFSAADVDAYLDIFFETLNNRLRHYIGQDEQIQEFRTTMKNRINSNPNAREYQNVLLGKINGEVLAAVTMLFPGETPSIPQTVNIPQQNSCFASIRRWIGGKANYIPTNMEECYIEMIGVKTAYRNHGIGSAMLECVEHFARQAGANLLTIHTHGQQLRDFFGRFGFIIDNTDSSVFWKWCFERQSINKLSKAVTLDEQNNDYTAGSYINESMVESVDE